MLRLLILGGLAAGAFLAWKKFSTAREHADFEEELHSSSTTSETPAPSPA